MAGQSQSSKSSFKDGVYSNFDSGFQSKCNPKSNSRSQQASSGNKYSGYKNPYYNKPTTSSNKHLFTHEYYETTDTF